MSPTRESAEVRATDRVPAGVHRRERLRRAVGTALLALVLVPVAAWSLLAVLLAGGGPHGVAGAGDIGWERWSAAGLLVAGLALAVARFGLRGALLATPVGFAAVLAWWGTLEPSNDRVWNPDQARLARASAQPVEGGVLVTLCDLRGFRYRSATDFDEHWYDATFDTRELEGVDFIVSHFAESRGPAHTMVSFRFAGERFVVFSAEIRKEVGESFGIVRGLFRQFELQYVVGDERDLVELRAAHRGEDVYLFPAEGSPEAQRAYFLDMVARLSELAERPEFYNTLTNNCTTNLVRHWERINGRELAWDSRMLLPGYADDLAFELGIVRDYGGPAETRGRAHITDLARSAAGRADFSLAIRAGL